MSLRQQFADLLGSNEAAPVPAVPPPSTGGGGGAGVQQHAPQRILQRNRAKLILVLVLALLVAIAYVWYHFFRVPPPSRDAPEID